MGISAGSRSGGNRHCLLDVIDSTEHFGEWLKRIDDLPIWFIKDVCEEAKAYGITAEEADAARDFLLERRTALPEIVDRHREEFTAIDDWTRPGRLF